MQSVLISIEVFTQPNCTHFTVIYSVKNTDCIEEGTVWVKVLLSFCNATCNVQIYQRLVQRKTLEINCIPYLTANFAPLRRLIKVDASKREPLVMEVAQWCTGTLIASCGWWVSPALDLCCSDFSASHSTVLLCSPSHWPRSFKMPLVLWSKGSHISSHNHHPPGDIGFASPSPIGVHSSLHLMESLENNAFFLALRVPLVLGSKEQSFIQCFFSFAEHFQTALPWSH